MNHDRLRILWPALLEVERAAATSLAAQSTRRAVARVRPIRNASQFRALRTDREWTTGEIARLGNIWDRVMNGTGAGGLLNSVEE